MRILSEAEKAIMRAMYRIRLVSRKRVEGLMLDI